MARKQGSPTQIDLPEEPAAETVAGTSPVKTKRTRAVKSPAERSTRRWFPLSLQWIQWTAILAGVAAILWSIYKVDHFLASDPRFFLPGSPGITANPNFRIEGMRHTPRERIARVFEPDFGRSVYLMPLAERRAQLSRIDWVQAASVSRLWPNRIVVSITERRPVAFVALPDLALIDADGAILSQPEQARFQLPVLTGVRREQPPTMRRERVQMMLEMLKQVGQGASQISEIDATSLSDLQVTFPGGARAYRLHLGNRNYASRMRSFFAHFDEVSKRFPTYTVFDLRLDGQMVALETKSDGN